MKMDEFDKLEHKVNSLINEVKDLRTRNEALRKELKGFKSGVDEIEAERQEIRNKVNSLIDLINSIKTDG